LPKSRLRDDRGQTLVEFAIVAVMLVMLLLGVVEFCRMVLVYTTVANATRAGARYAIVHGTDNPASADDIKAVVRNFLGTAPLDTTSVSTDVNYPGDCKNPGCEVVVTAAYPYQPMIGYFPWPVITLRSTSQGAITF
jgi:Flp pilus assembly protein TadG